MNQYDGALTAAILAAASSPEGVATNEIPGYTVAQVGRVIDKLKTKKQLFTAKISHRSARYFTTEAAARAVGPAKLETAAPVTVRQRLVPHSAWHQTEAVIDESKVNRYPTPPDRFAISGDVPSVINSAQARPWAKAATA